MRATIFIGSLKSDPNDSNTVLLSKRVKQKLESYGVEVVMRYLRKRRMAYGVEFNTGEDSDEAGVYFRDFNRSDIIIFATPIWWGAQSSLITQLMERVGAYDDDYIATGKSKLYDKVFGCIITASNDGFQHAQGNLYAFASNLGMTVPPEAHATWGTTVGSDKAQVDNPETENMVKNMCRNLFLWSKAITSIGLGSKALEIKPGRVGLDSNDELQTSD
jgi:multimeric flavodoxin WrbA